MAKKSIIGKIPINFLKKAEDIKKNGNFKNRTDAFRFINNIQPIILEEKTIRLPKSKSILKQIDVRYFFKDEIKKDRQK